VPTNMTKTEIMTNIRELIESQRDSDFFNAQEVKDIVEYICGEIEQTGPVKDLFENHIQGWEYQITTGCHPCLKNCETIYSLMLENTIFEDDDLANSDCEDTEANQEEANEATLCASSEAPKSLSLVEFVSGILPSIGQHIKSVHKDGNTFTITVQ
jgi:hypothetical protein